MTNTTTRWGEPSLVSRNSLHAMRPMGAALCFGLQTLTIGCTAAEAMAHDTHDAVAPAAEELLANVAVAGQAQSVAAVDRHHQHVRIQRPAVDDMDFGMQLYPALGPKPWP